MPRGIHQRCLLHLGELQQAESLEKSEWPVPEKNAFAGFPLTVNVRLTHRVHPDLCEVWAAVCHELLWQSCLLAPCLKLHFKDKLISFLWPPFQPLQGSRLHVPKGQGGLCRIQLSFQQTSYLQSFLISRAILTRLLLPPPSCCVEGSASELAAPSTAPIPWTMEGSLDWVCPFAKSLMCLLIGSLCPYWRTKQLVQGKVGIICISSRQEAGSRLAWSQRWWNQKWRGPQAWWLSQSAPLLH